jgi:predicted ATPase
MVAELTGGKALPPEVQHEVLAKTDGVPLFVEELTKTVLESGLLRDEGERYVLAGPLPPLAISATLRDSLMARLDKLAPVKEVAQIGAAIGREFDYELLAIVAPFDETQLQGALHRLAEAELIFAQGTPRGSYVFKHALVRDAAYESLLKSRRQQLHARIVQALEQRFPATAEAEPAVLARHCAEAGLVDKAVEYSLKAGKQAVARSAMAEAVAQFRSALDRLKTVPDAPERRNLELDLQLALGSALFATKGVAAAETASAYARARELCLEVDASPKIFPALFGHSVVRQQRGELIAAHEFAGELLRLAEERGDIAAQVAGCRAIGSALFLLGRLVESRTYLERGLALYDPQRDRTSGFDYAMDSRVNCLVWISQALLALGYPAQALARKDEALAYARELAHPTTFGTALLAAGWLHERLRQSQEARAMAEPLITFATEQGLPLWSAAGRVRRGWALAKGGLPEEGIEEIRAGLADYRATGAELWSPDFLALLAEAHGRAGQAAVGLSILADALRSGRKERGELDRVRSASAQGRTVARAAQS